MYKANGFGGRGRSSGFRGGGFRGGNRNNYKYK